MEKISFEKTLWVINVSIILSVILVLVSCSRQTSPLSQTVVIDKINTPTMEVKAVWEQKWADLIKEARKEQWLVIYSPSSGETRSAITRTMKDKFGISVDWTTATTVEVLNKVLAENRAGLRMADVVISGTTGFNLKSSGIVEPMDSFLLIPEVLDASKWYQGKFPWWDDQHMIISSLINISPIIAINTQLVKENDITSFRDLLNPKWKGQISMTSPLIGGTGAASFGMVGGFIMGWDYMKELAKQEPVIIRDTRLGVEWLARGKQSIGWAARSESVIEFQNAGAPLKYIAMREGTYGTEAGTAFSKLKNSPHNASSAVFINWILTQEGQTIFSKTRGFESNRIDVPKDFIDPIRLRVPGVNYIMQDEKTRAMEDEWMQKAKEIFGPLLQ